MLESHWFALGAFALLMTIAWLFVETRITTTTILAGASWATMSLTGGSLTRVTESGIRMSVEATELQYVTLVLAALSLLAALLYHLGVYPPQETDAYETTA